MKVAVKDALLQLKDSKNLFLPLFNHGSLQIEIYKPDKIDHQSPHKQDEVYIIISGNGEFLNDGIITNFTPGDFLFVPAGTEHRFLNFSDDFVTWVVFYGPEGGEQA
ncbi:MAG: cupin domain-containing protein [Niabella sp.]|nr:cupin domain-containing protein [Niabella sp.]